MSIDFNKMDVFSRQALMFSSEVYEIPVKIYGVGFIGSNLAYTFAKTGFKKIFLIDNDTVKDHNLLNQFYRQLDLGKNKVDALKENIESQLSQLTGVSLFPMNYTLEQMFEMGVGVNNNEIIVLSTDNKESRIHFAQEIVKNWDRNGGYKDTIFLFVNTSGDVIYLGVNKGDKSFFETMITQLSSLTEDQVSVGLCGEKSSFYLGNLVSGYMISEVRKLFSEKKDTYTREALFAIKQNYFNYNFRWFGKDSSKELKELLLNSKMEVDSIGIVKRSLCLALYVLSSTNEEFINSDQVKDLFMTEITRSTMTTGQVLWPVRVSLSREETSPGAFELIYILGKTKSIQRIQKVLSLI